MQEESGTNVLPILHELQTSKTPPTFHRTNKFTEGFQAIMDSYGVSAYQEINPGLFAVVTFPFLFAVMFGDIGHGCILVMAALYWIIREKTLAKQDNGEVRSCYHCGGQDDEANHGNDADRWTILLVRFCRRFWNPLSPHQC